MNIEKIALYPYCLLCSVVMEYHVHHQRPRLIVAYGFIRTRGFTSHMYDVYAYVSIADMCRKACSFQSAFCLLREDFFFFCAHAVEILIGLVAIPSRIVPSLSPPHFPCRRRPYTAANVAVPPARTPRALHACTCSRHGPPHKSISKKRKINDGRVNTTTIAVGGESGRQIILLATACTPRRCGSPPSLLLL